jgi:hypothetical protein
LGQRRLDGSQITHPVSTAGLCQDPTVYLQNLGQS